MSRTERFGWRDRTYSVWHRSQPWALSFLDVDWMERCDVCKEILCLYELAVDTGKDHKDYWATQKLAQMAGLRAYVVLYAPGPGFSITGFRVMQIAPRVTDWGAYTPEMWVQFLLDLRTRHGHPAKRDVPAPADAWRGVPERCATCGAPPRSRFPDGSPLYGCSHPPVMADAQREDIA